MRLVVKTDVLFCRVLSFVSVAAKSHILEDALAGFGRGNY